MAEIVELRKNVVKEVLAEFLKMHAEFDSLIVIGMKSEGMTKIGMTKMRPSEACFAAKIFDKIIAEEIDDLFYDAEPEK